MTQVKLTSEKWWVLLNESWVEIDEKDWDQTKRLTWANLGMPDLMFEASEEALRSWSPTTNQIYSLPEEVEFEIKWYRALKAGEPKWELREDHFNDVEEDKMFYAYMQVAHLKEVSLNIK